MKLKHSHDTFQIYNSQKNG
uniref:Uncharacterized protein n=1 Tax=Anguilla anguilla TaxID=7936 RepID=A0A0E9QJJ4_ANGAN